MNVREYPKCLGLVNRNAYRLKMTSPIKPVTRRVNEEALECA